MQPFLALITPVGGGGGEGPPGIWGPGSPMPNPPIFWPGFPGGGGGGGGSPPGIWGPGGPMPNPPIYWPGFPGGGGGGGGGSPPGIWGGGNVPLPNPPIYFPDNGGGGSPPGIWGGGNVPMPQPPIELPEGLPPETEEGPIDWKVGWTAQTGWIIVGVPSGEHPVPSRRRKGRKDESPPQG